MIEDGVVLAALLERERETLLNEWRQQVRTLPAAAQLDVPTLNDHVPKLLDKLVEALRHPERGLPLPLTQDEASTEHGAQREEVGYDIGEVVAEYSMLRGCIHTLALIHGVPLRDSAVNLLNALLDRAIGAAVEAFVRHCDVVQRQRREEHLSFLAHDLRTPLHAVVLATRVLEQNGLGEDERQRMVDILKRNVRQLSGLVESVLERDGTHLSSDSRKKPTRRPASIWPLVEELVSDWRANTEAGTARLVNEVPDDLMVQVDAGLLRRVLGILISSVQARGGARPHVVCIGAQPLDKVGGGVVCWIEGNGSEGHPAGFLQQSVEWGADRFAPDDKQTGLDLAAARELVEAQGGGIELLGSAGDGRATGVRFWVPGQNGQDPAA